MNPQPWRSPFATIRILLPSKRYSLSYFATCSRNSIVWIVAVYALLIVHFIIIYELSVAFSTHDIMSYLRSWSIVYSRMCISQPNLLSLNFSKADMIAKCSSVCAYIRSRITNVLLRQSVGRSFCKRTAPNSYWQLSHCTHSSEYLP